jgi:hypothetical protein
MLQSLLWLLFDGELAFLVALGFRSREFPSFEKWWWAEGVMIWLIAVGVFSILLLAFFGADAPA